MQRFIIYSASIFLLSIAAATANTPPVVATQLPDQTIYQTLSPRIDLTNAFSDPDTKAVRFSTVLGQIDVALYSQAMPITVANFLNYVNQGRYFKIDPTTHHRASSFVHRSVSGSITIIQGGGFIGTVDPLSPAVVQPTAVATFPAIQNERNPALSNVRGTIAMAKVPGNANSATSQWFINVANDTSLDTTADNYNVFGRVVNNGLTTVDKIAALPVYGLDSGNFASVPLINYNTSQPVAVSNLVSIPDIIEIPPFTFAATSSDTNIATVTVNSDGRALNVTGQQIGTATITVTATDYDGASISQHFNVNIVASPSRLANISTRLEVGSDPNALIGGFILSGNSPKRVLIRAIGPSLAASGVTDALSDPTLDLHDSTHLLASNDDWGDSANRQAIIDTGIPPTNSSESAILTTLPAGGAAYTAIVRGVNNPNGVGLVEVYDLDTAPGSTIANISTRGLVQTGTNVMIGGFILPGPNSTKVLIRAIGPSLSSSGISDPLSDPTLELHNAQGATIASNDNWQTNANASDIQATGVAPKNPLESALLTTLASGNYTAIVRGVNNATGVALVEVYQIP